MYILITGAAGFVGQILAKRLLDDNSHKLLLADVIEPPIPKDAKFPDNAKTIKADLCVSPENVVDEQLEAAFLFHGIMSSGSETNFDLGMCVNFDATRNLLEVLRKKTPGIRVIYSSSQAVYGSPLPDVVDDSTKITPLSSYGAEKLMCEILITEFTRRNFINGFVLRFPTISVRPGKPTAAASSWLSGMVREPFNDLESVIPIEDKSFKSWLCSPRTLVSNLVHSLTIPSSLPLHKRQINMPGISTTIDDMLSALSKIGGPSKLALVTLKNEPEFHPILYSWPQAFDISPALALGFSRDTSFEQAVADYKHSLLTEPLADNRALSILSSARAGKYGVVGACCYNTEGILATIGAAESKSSPAMILLFPWAMHYASTHLVRFAADACRSAKVPVTLHMDHAQDPAIIRQAADTGCFDSIMVDMSHHEKEENLRLTTELVEYCHARGVATEAEPGRIEGGEDGVQDTGDLEGLLTSREEARRVVDTGISWLAPSFGNVHG